MINKYKGTSSTGSHTMPTQDSLGSGAVPSLLQTLLFPSFWYKLVFVSSVHRLLFHNCTGSFRCFLAYTPIPTGECSGSGNCCEGFFFTREIILLSSTTVVLRGRPGLLRSAKSFLRQRSGMFCNGQVHHLT